MSPRSSEPISGVLLLAHGGPDSLEDVEPFLVNLRSGKSFSAHLLEEVRERYRRIGGRSPLLEISLRQAQALERKLNAAGGRFRVYVGMRNWRPFISETMQKIQQEGVSRLLALCLAPQNSRRSVGLYFQHVREAQEKLGGQIPTDFVDSWHQEPLLIEAFTEKLKEGLAAFPNPEDAPPEVLFTAHSLPEKILAEGDPYDREVRETAAAVAERCGIYNWKFAYQSQGATAEPWLGPTVESLLEVLSQAGSRRVLLVPIGFVADHVEILYDIDIAFRQFAEERGIVLRRAQSLNDSPTLIRALSVIVRRHFAAQGETDNP